MKRLIVDLDGTLTVDDVDVSYNDRAPRLDVIEKLRHYKALGFERGLFTARNMRTYQGAVGKINVHTLPVIMEWLERHKVPFDEVIVGKPWCGTQGFYVDDRAIRPAEFVTLTEDQIERLLRGADIE